MAEGNVATYGRSSRGVREIQDSRVGARSSTDNDRYENACIQVSPRRIILLIGTHDFLPLLH